MSIHIEQIQKKFDQSVIIDNISLDIPSNALVALLGPSGCGKTTLLRIIAGLESPDSGSVYLDGEDVSNIQTHKRKLGFVFQHYALFKHMTIFDNISFGLRVKSRKTRPNKSEIHKKVYELLELIQLKRCANLYPAQLSGGQRQRVALARALAVEPKILLLDEPFGALDSNIRKDLRRWLRRLHDELHVTTIFVTHDQEEALEVSDHVVLMNQGHIEQYGSPDYITEHPATPFVYSFLGGLNLFHGRVEGEFLCVDKTMIPLDQQGLKCGDKMVGFVKPADLRIESENTISTGFVANISRIMVSGSIARVELCNEAGKYYTAELSATDINDRHLKERQVVRIIPNKIQVFNNVGV